jgi:septal ring factor EnvC (AmiA/AmiB activator)
MNPPAMNPPQSAPTIVHRVKDGVQKAAVRVIASELDRRSGSLEKAVADVNARIAALGTAQQTLSEQINAANDYVRRVHDHLGSVESAHNRLMTMHTQLVGRLDVSEAERAESQRDLHALVGEVTAMREAFARLDRLVEGRATTALHPEA